MPNPIEADHATLIAVADALITPLSDFDQIMLREEVDHAQHHDFAARGRMLSMHLEAALTLARENLYPSAFTVIRTALEHQVLDELVMLGDRYVQVFPKVPEEAFLELVSRFEEGLEPTIASRPTLGTAGNMRVVRRGVFDRDASPGQDDETISLLYFVLDEYSPTTPRPSDAASSDDGVSRQQSRADRARRNRDLWRSYLRWDSLVESLVANERYDETQADRLRVHYRFLSGYTHAITASYSAAYDSRGLLTPQPPTYDHYSSELILLYILAIGSDELSSLLEMTSRPPRVIVDNHAELSALVDQARATCAHLWPPRGLPAHYDRVEEANRRTFAALRDGDRGYRAPPPDTIPADEVRYYEHPLKRIVALHFSSTEMMTGLTYHSPYERADARLRRV